MKAIALLVTIALLPPADSISQRFAAPSGYQVVPASKDSFGLYLQQIPLKPAGTQTFTYDNQVAATNTYTAAVIDLDHGTGNLQQCADAVIRLRAEYLWHKKQYANIHFNFTSGFRCDYVKYAEGYRYSNGKWIKQAEKSYSYTTFRKYLNLVYTYAGTASLEKELKLSGNLAPGRIFIKGGFPGHCFIIVNMAVNSAQDTVFQLAQSFMPAQDIQVLKDGLGNAWFSLQETADIPYSELISRRYLKQF